MWTSSVPPIIILYTFKVKSKQSKRRIYENMFNMYEKL